MEPTIRNKLLKATCVASALRVSAGYCSIRGQKAAGGRVQASMRALILLTLAEVLWSTTVPKTLCGF